MACTAYIFQEDYRKLNEEARSTYGRQRGLGGSLFGQWTSTGNPVVHYAVTSKEAYSSATIGDDLWKGYRVCHIGEWRPVTSFGQDRDPARRALLSNFLRDPKRCLVLDVDGGKIFPYLFEDGVEKGRGTVEYLSGENPFNRPDVLRPQQPARQQYDVAPRQQYDMAARQQYDVAPRQQYDMARRHEGQFAAAQQWNRPPRQRPQMQEAVTNQTQWYAGEGSKKLQKVLEDFKKIAYQEQVEMSRDTATQNLSMSFTDKRNMKKWEVKFPSMFPSWGATLIEHPNSPSERRLSQAGTDKASQAVKNMISCINQPAIY